MELITAIVLAGPLGYLAPKRAAAVRSRRTSTA
jgi:hypothetical protein